MSVSHRHRLWCEYIVLSAVVSLAFAISYIIRPMNLARLIAMTIRRNEPTCITDLVYQAGRYSRLDSPVGSTSVLARGS